MALAALGCNPTATGDSLDDIGGVALGTLAFSPAGGMYIAVKADGAIAQYDACVMEGGYAIDQLNAGAADIGNVICIPQVAIADDEYGWALIFGTGTARAGAAVAVGGQVSAHATDGRLDDATTHEIGPAAWVEAATGAGNATHLHRVPHEGCLVPEAVFGRRILPTTGHLSI